MHLFICLFAYKFVFNFFNKVLHIATVTMKLLILLLKLHIMLMTYLLHLF